MSGKRRLSGWSGRLEHLERRELLTLALKAQNLLATAQAPFSGEVATLVDTDLTQGPADFNTPPGSVTIDWGDGSTSPGTVLGPLVAGLFEVDGAHTYASAGAYTTTVNVVDRGGQSASARGTAIVGGPATSPSLVVEPSRLSGTAGQPTTPATVAVILDPNPTDTPADIQAAVTWGDGNTSTMGTGVTVQGGGGIFLVNATNSYSAPGTYTFVVTVARGGQATAAVGAAIITAPPAPPTPPPLSVKPNPLTGNAGQATSPATVAIILDPNPDDTPDRLKATVAWGDGSTSTTGAGVTVTGGGGVFLVNATHTYATQGTYTFVVSVSDSETVTAAGATGQATIAPAPTYTLKGRQLVIPAGQPLLDSTSQPQSGVTVATVSDPNLGDVPANFSASIDWGDGQTGVGVVSGGNGSFTIAGSKTYNIPGTYTIKVVLVDTMGRSATTTSTAVVVNTNPPGNNFSFTGALTPTPANGPYTASGIATTNRPIFMGTAPPFAVVQLFARRIDVDATLPLGQAIASGSGAWNLSTGPLADGTYNITASVTPPGGYPGPMVPITANDGQVVINTAHPIPFAFVHRGPAHPEVVRFRASPTGRHSPTPIQPGDLQARQLPQAPTRAVPRPWRLASNPPAAGARDGGPPARPRRG